MLVDRGERKPQIWPRCFADEVATRLDTHPGARGSLDRGMVIDVLWVQPERRTIRGTAKMRLGGRDAHLRTGVTLGQ